MKIRIDNSILIELYKIYTTLQDEEGEVEFFNDWNYINSCKVWDRDVRVNLDLSKISISFIEKYLYPFENDHLQSKLRRYKKVNEQSERIVCKKLTEFPTIFKAFVSKAKNRLLFSIDADTDCLNPYAVIDCVYNPPKREERAYVVIKMLYINLGKSENQNIILYNEDLNSTIVDILLNQGYILEDEEIYSKYLQDLKLFSKIYKDVGGQYVLSGKGHKYTKKKRYYDDSYHYTFTSSILDPGDYICRAVVDDFKEIQEPKSIKSNQFSNLFKEQVKIPYHLNLRFFDLYNHSFCSCHLSCVKQYEYDQSILNKLVLDEEIKNVISTLVSSEDDIMEDIIKGKTGGIIVISTGPPGVGKTLTAEAYSEIIGRPLYKVQCSQLGLSVKELESNLQTVLDRAVKWNAILLIDEADVYIRSRGGDIHQNAVVGTFLRVLEYYSGVLFMTSNLGDSIDDAIMSRATAHVQYYLPRATQRVEIAKVLSEQFKIELDSNCLNWFYSKQLSGRDIKSILRFCNKMCKDKITEDILEKYSKYIYIISDEDYN